VSSTSVLRGQIHIRSLGYGGLAVSMLALLASLGSPAPATAQQSRPRAQIALPTAAVKPQTLPQGPYIAVISIGGQKLTLYNREGVVATSPISSGRSGFETPQGVFSIIERKEEHYSNLYDDAAMPFMQRITWSGVAMHAGVLPGYPASHGCIRLPHGFAQRLFGITGLNTRVVVTARDTEPLEIAHTALFQPRLDDGPDAATPPAASPPAPARPSQPLASNESPMMLGVKPPKPAEPIAATPDPAKPRRAVTSIAESARLKRAAAVAEAAQAVKAAEIAKAAVRPRLIEAQKAERNAKHAELAVKRAEQRAQAIGRQVTRARGETAIEKAKAAQVKIEAELVTLRTSAVELRSAAVTRSGEAKDAAEAAKAAEQARIAAQAATKDAARLTEPISVFVSRTDGRLYVRQGLQPVFDMPITIKDASQPIGTHVFTAIDEGSAPLSVRWNVVTVETGLPEAPVQKASRRRGEPAPEMPKPTTVAATAALDRIEFPQEAIDRIAPYLQVGSSLIVSDLGLSIETGRGTDFVILTRGEEQARASIAKYIADKRNAARRDRERARERSRNRERSGYRWFWEGDDD